MYITINLTISSICHKLYFCLYCKTKEVKDFDLLQSTVFGLKKWCHTRLTPGYLEAHGVDPRGADGHPVDVRDSPVVRRLLQQSHTRAGWAAGACRSSMNSSAGQISFLKAVALITYAVEAALDYLCRWGRSWLLMPFRPLLITYAVEAALDYLCRLGRSWLLMPLRPLLITYAIEAALDYLCRLCCSSPVSLRSSLVSLHGSCLQLVRWWLSP